MKLPCRYCNQMFHDVDYNEGFIDGDKYHWIVSASGLLSGDRKQAAKKPGLKAISPDDFFETEPQSFPELPEPSVQEVVDGLV